MIMYNDSNMSDAEDQEEAHYYAVMTNFASLLRSNNPKYIGMDVMGYLLQDNDKRTALAVLKALVDGLEHAYVATVNDVLSGGFSA